MILENGPGPANNWSTIFCFCPIIGSFIVENVDGAIEVEGADMNSGGISMLSFL